ncbi:hypothetical protein FBU30_008036 [Linnemannia zychae]|nr:hypothetical protein FBU30_008036 [Linnemannia zychae]
MRIPTIILLSSVALSLLVNAENTPTVADVDIAGNIAVDPIPDRSTANTATSTTTSPNADANTSSDTVLAEGTLRMKEDNKVYPVGKGIVFTKTTFVVDDNKDKNKDVKPKDDFSVTGFLGDLLGIDISSGDNDKKKKKKDPTDSSDGVDINDPNTFPLYGDDGYQPRPVPKDCPELEFLDQMIWDQQGSGKVIEMPSPGPDAILPPSTPQTTNVPVTPTEETNRDNNLEHKSTESDKKANGDSSTTTTPVSVSTGEKNENVETILANFIQSSIDEVFAPTDAEDIDDKAKSTKDSQGSHICPPGGCSKDVDDDDNDDKPKRRRVRHKQKKFLKQFRGKALKIDGTTGCPIPSHP